MLERELINLIGQPTDVNTSTGSYGLHKQYVYRTDGGKTKYYYFEDGKLTSMQE
jgi:hypothetical protein